MDENKLGGVCVTCQVGCCRRSGSDMKCLVDIFADIFFLVCGREKILRGVFILRYLS